MNIEFFARVRQRIGYASSWFGMLGVPLLVVDLVQKKLELVNVHISFGVLVVSTIATMALGGYLFERFGFIQAEYTWAYNMNQKMQKDIQEKTK